MIRTAFFCIVTFSCTDLVATTIDDIFQDYGEISTVAGTGFIPEKAVSGWDEDMEGGAATEAELSRPHMAMADLVGNVYIADKDAHAVRVVRPDGSIHTIAGTNEPGGFDVEEGIGTDVPLWSPNGLYTFPDGTTYILDLGNSMVRKLTPDGYLTTLFTDDFGISIGRGLWVSPDESLVFYASNSEIRSWSPDEGVEVYADGFQGLGNLAVDPTDGNLVATDRVGHLVYKILPDGEKEIIAGTGEIQGGFSGDAAIDVGLKEVRGIAFNPDGSYFLATHDGGQIWFVDTDEDIHLAIDGDDDGTHAGDGLPISDGGKRISEPRAITIAPNKDLLITEHDAGFIRRVEWIGDPVFKPGDVNLDGIIDVRDIDLLSAAIRTGDSASKFDVDGTGKVDSTDHFYWVDTIKNTHIGDANLDGEFNSRDFVDVFQANEYEDNIDGNSTWATGDWNADADFTSADFVIAFQANGYEKGPKALNTVPEPSSLNLALIGCLVLFKFRVRFVR